MFRNDYVEVKSGALNKWPGWQSTIRASGGVISDRDQLAPTMESFEEEHPSFEVASRECLSDP